MAHSRDEYVERQGRAIEARRILSPLGADDLADAAAHVTVRGGGAASVSTLREWRLADPRLIPSREQLDQLRMWEYARDQVAHGGDVTVRDPARDYPTDQFSTREEYKAYVDERLQEEEREGLAWEEECEAQMDSEFIARTGLDARTARTARLIDDAAEAAQCCVSCALEGIAGIDVAEYGAPVTPRPPSAAELAALSALAALADEQEGARGGLARAVPHWDADAIRAALREVAGVRAVGE